ncbi:MAG: flavodoxin family protein [Lachnospiraceae bacterium]|nr:flavodoxin family protein [Lachnospiraceae bacterium]
MKVLVVNGSPRNERSNTMCLSRAFLDGAGWMDAEIIEVSNANIKSCLGCFACWSKTPGKCAINDGMGEILDKIISADVIVWSFPLYYFSVPGSLKSLIDRQLPMNLPFMAQEIERGGHPQRYDLTHQKHVVISTCGFWTTKGNYDSVISMFNHFCGEGNYSTILCGQGELFNVPELKGRTDAYLELVRRAGAEYAAGAIGAKTQAELAEPLYPRDVFEKMADASWGVAQNGDLKNSTDDSLIFTKQMAALYRPDGAERVLEIHYTDIDKTYQIWLTKEGSKVITEDFKPYTTRIETPYPVWRSVARGEISGQEALFQRQYKVLGDFSLMLNWDELFGATPISKPSKPEPLRKTNMIVLLLPWIVIWMSVSINSTIGSAISISVAACMTLFWLKFQPVVYEQISVPIVAILSLTVLIGCDIRLIVPLSYLVFGLMWTIGAFRKIPLTAHYSAANYGEEKAFANPLFISTNRILTLAWGALYLVTPIWTYILMGTGFLPYVGLINSILPALMGLFTAWFQKWYPARFARG